MGHQLPVAKRARHPAAKEHRRQSILTAARRLLERSPLEAVTMADVAAEVGLAKGTTFLYFPTKEALCLDVLDGLLDEWFDALDVELDKPGRFTPARLVRALVDSVGTRALLVRLMAVLSNDLERNVEIEQVVAFKMRLLARLGATGARLDRRLELKEGQGARLLLRLNALVVGLHQACDLGPVARAALARPELAPLRVDFDAELPVLLAALVRGLLPDH
jgi:AcrR family transcriptional regulator